MNNITQRTNHQSGLSENFQYGDSCINPIIYKTHKIANFPPKTR
ncbi:hypothetical protein BAZSYMA_ACONTIG143448_0 [Bathymodiolus azoricus thioautotrophic gill symbiont]|uniref:Uncharacterized protein n=1 Tax=Bathymodiolus azoricus thioautotrophic gill symbiont TaxID=235205 RepID=A0A1H6MXJ6_9GAMM|nr:hypothetical protein BAZSYMA_ACONTIG143448_0 [Bathymodiolus azoricus thioautotrophic gill symbiont]